MKIKHSILLIFLFLTFINESYACDCDSEGHFLTVAHKSDLVALVKISKYLTFKNVYGDSTPMSMEVEIIKTYKGKEERTKLTVWGDNGNLCRPYLSEFKIDSFYVIAFANGSDGTNGYVHTNEKTTDYSISNCGDFWLIADIENKIAKGLVREKQGEISFGELYRQFNGDKTQNLTPNDFKEIYQLALDFPDLQEYYHIETDTLRKQVVIKYFGEANHNNLIGVNKFGKQVLIKTEKEINEQNIKNYFGLGDWICGENSVRLQLYYVGEGLTLSLRLLKIDNHWKIDNHALWEE